MAVWRLASAIYTSSCKSSVRTKPKLGVYPLYMPVIPAIPASRLTAKYRSPATLIRIPLLTSSSKTVNSSASLSPLISNCSAQSSTVAPSVVSLHIFIISCVNCLSITVSCIFYILLCFPLHPCCEKKPAALAAGPYFFLICVHQPP